MAKKMGRGFHRHHGEHVINARRGSRHRRITLPDRETLKHDIKEGSVCRVLDDSDKRSIRAKSQDFGLQANETLSPKKLKNIDRWARNPDRVDLEGVDSKTEAYSFEDHRPPGRRSAKREVVEVLGEDADRFDLEAETDSSLSPKENAEETRRKLQPRIRDLHGF